MVALVDVYTYTIGYYNYLDYGYFEFLNSGASFTENFNPPATDYYNLVAGMTAIRLPSNQAISFFLMTNNLYNTSTAFIELKT